MESDRLDASVAFMLQLGMRSIIKKDDYAILELRGGTHLIISQQASITPREVDFDLMVEDLESYRDRLIKLGLSPSGLQRGRVHDSFTITDPCGNRITFNSSHVSDLPV